MSPTFKKLIPLIIVIIVFAGGYLLSDIVSQYVGGDVHVESVALQAQSVQERLNYLSVVGRFESTVRDSRFDALTSITATPAQETTGRANPFTP